MFIMSIGGGRFRLIMVCFHFVFLFFFGWVNMLILTTERDANMDYGDGWKQYGFAAPFLKDDTAKTA